MHVPKIPIGISSSELVDIPSKKNKNKKNPSLHQSSMKRYTSQFNFIILRYTSMKSSLQWCCSYHLPQLRLAMSIYLRLATGSCSYLCLYSDADLFLAVPCYN